MQTDAAKWQHAFSDLAALQTRVLAELMLLLQQGVVARNAAAAQAAARFSELRRQLVDEQVRAGRRRTTPACWCTLDMAACIHDWLYF
ncbi:hypothetical protein EON66_09835 [archaeon]|nr:MAG: hypothetical protein EON66_09835 [archaeon]